MNDSIHQVLAELIGNGVGSSSRPRLGNLERRLCHGPLDGYPGSFVGLILGGPGLKIVLGVSRTMFDVLLG